MATKPTYAHKSTKVSYVIIIVCLLHVSATLVAILREIHYKTWMYRFLVIVQLDAQILFNVFIYL